MKSIYVKIFIIITDFDSSLQRIVLTIEPVPVIENREYIHWDRVWLEKQKSKVNKVKKQAKKLVGLSKLSKT